jgi:hypothetical protein
MSSHYDNQYNYLQGLHSQMKKYVNSLHPNIYIAIELLRKEQSLASIGRIRDYTVASISKRRKNKVITNEIVVNL